MPSADPHETGPPTGASSPGPGVDRHGTPVVDPTKNVLDLVAAAMQRQDDLRGQDSYWQNYVAELRAGHNKELRQIEADRLDAIQARSDLTVRGAAEVQAAQQQALATQVSTTADAFRASIATELAPIKASIEDLRRAQYEAQGQKTQVVETSAESRDALSLDAVRIAATSARTQMYALVIAAIVLGVSMYAAFHR